MNVLCLALYVQNANNLPQQAVGSSSLGTLKELSNGLLKQNATIQMDQKE